MSRIKSPYWLAALVATTLVAPSYAMYKYQQHIGWDFIPRHHATIYKVATSVADVVLLPGEVLEVICSPGGGHDMNLNSVLIPFGSWLLCFLLLLGFFILRARCVRPRN